MIQIITYDLRKPGRDYSRLHDAIKAIGSWCHPLDSVWLVETSESPASVRDRMLREIDSNDGLFVAKLEYNCAWNNIASGCPEWITSPHRKW